MSTYTFSVWVKRPVVNHQGKKQLESLLKRCRLDPEILKDSNKNGGSLSGQLDVVKKMMVCFCFCFRNTPRNETQKTGGLEDNSSFFTMGDFLVFQGVHRFNYMW